MKPKKLFALILALLLVLALAGCGSSSSYPYEAAKSDAAYIEPMVPMAAPAAAPAGAASAAGGWYYDDYAAEAEYYEYDAPAEYKTESQPAGPMLPENVKLIYTANIEMETTEFDASVNALRNMVNAMGGYYQSSDMNNYGSYRYAYYTIRIPAQNFDTFCDNLGDLCQVNSINRSAEDVSEYYYDNEARLATQQTKLERLQKLLSEAEEMEDIITLETAISETELAIENLTGTLRHYDSLVGYSTIYLNLSEVYKLTEVEQPVIGFGAKLSSAFKSGSTRFVNGLERAALSVARGWIGWLVFLIIVAVIVIVVLRIVKRARRKNEKAAAATPAPNRTKPVAPAAAPAPAAPKKPEEKKPE